MFLKQIIAIFFRRVLYFTKEGIFFKKILNFKKKCYLFLFIQKKKSDFFFNKKKLLIIFGASEGAAYHGPLLGVAHSGMACCGSLRGGACGAQPTAPLGVVYIVHGSRPALGSGARPPLFAHLATSDPTTPPCVPLQIVPPHSPSTQSPSQSPPHSSSSSSLLLQACIQNIIFFFLSNV